MPKPKTTERERIANTLAYLRKCQAARAAGLPVRFTTDPAWLVNMAVNRRAGWPDDPSHLRGSCMPVGGRYPRKASGDCYACLRSIAREVNMGVIVRLARLGEHRWLARRLPGRFES